MLNLYEDIFGKSYPLVKDTSPLVITSENVLFGEVSITRNFTENEPVALVNVVDRNSQLLVLRNQLPLLRSLALCVKMGWMAILVSKLFNSFNLNFQIIFFYDNQFSFARFHSVYFYLTQCKLRWEIVILAKLAQFKFWRNWLDNVFTRFL